MFIAVGEGVCFGASEIAKNAFDGFPMSFAGVV